MKAHDVMVRDIVTVGPDTDVVDVVALLVKHDICAVPVVDPDTNLVGILSEADLLEREELGAAHHHPWWIETMMPVSKLAKEFAKEWRLFGFSPADVLWLIAGIALVGVVALIATA